MEALFCGTPVVGFATGGIPDMIRPGFNGLLCAEKSTQALVNAVNEALNSLDSFDRRAIREDAINRFSSKRQAKAYIDLFSELTCVLS